MEFSKRDRFISLIFPFICVLYGVWVLLGRVYHPMFQLVTGLAAIAGGVVTGVVMMARKINIVPIIKVPAIAAVVTFWLHFVTMTNIVTGDWQDIFYIGYYIVVDAGSIVLMTVKLPNEAERRQKLAVFFMYPFLYTLLNTVMRAFSDFLSGMNLLN